MNPSEHPVRGEPISTAPKYRIGSLSENVKDQEWATLVSCANILEPDMVKSQHEAAGFKVFIPDEHLMTAAAWALNMYGYVRVQVKPAEYNAAADLLCATGDAARE